jgi:putative intracellular protease/amidase
MTEPKRVLIVLPSSANAIITQDSVNSLLSFLQGHKVIVETTAKQGSSALLTNNSSLSFEEALHRFISARENARVKLDENVRPAEFSITRPRRVKYGSLYYFAVLILSGSDFTEFNDPTLLQVLKEVYLSQGIVGGLAYGQAIVSKVIVRNHSIIEGLKVTCFGKTDGGDGSLEKILYEAGANVSFVAAKKPHVVIDGSIMTAQNPESAEMLAENLVDRLGGIVTL